MKLLHRFAPQPLTAFVMCSLAAVILWQLWAGILQSQDSELNLETTLLAVFLAGCVVAAGQYSIHINHRTKVSLTTPPLYLMALLLPAPLAALAAGLGMLCKEWLLRDSTKNKPSDIATAAGRWVLVEFLSAGVAHHTITATSGLLTFLLPAVVMFAGDVVSVAFEIAPMCHVPPAKIMVRAVKEGAVCEGVQYLLGILGAVASLHDMWALVLLTLPMVIVYHTFKRIHELQDRTKILLAARAEKVYELEPYTGAHERRVAEWCGRILEQLNTSGPEADLVVLSAMVHDTGKTDIPLDILRKPGRLTSEELQIMRSHTQHGLEVLADQRDFSRGADIIRHHHERWDGTGYPDRLKAFDIPFGARVIAVADSFDAMTSHEDDRPYRRPLSVQQAAAVLQQERGKQFDPAVVNAFLAVLEEMSEGPTAEPTMASALYAGAAAGT